MNIQKTTLTPKGNLNTLKSTAAAEEKPQAQQAAAPEETFTPEAEGEGRGSAAFRGAVRKGVAWGDGVVGKTAGGISGFALAIGGGLALSLGGAMVGGLVGGSFGSAVSALQADGPISFITGTFGNMGSAMSVGSTIGSVAGIVGGGMLGLKVGGAAGKAVAFVPGAIVGGVQGLVNPGSIPPPEQQEQKDAGRKQELRGLFKAGAKVGGGVGLLAGLSGGFVTGATLTAAGTIVTDVAQGDFTFNNFRNQLTTTAVMGGLIGAGVLGTVGALGGEAAFGSAPQWAWDKTGGKFTANQPGIQERINKAEVALNDREETLKSQAANADRELSSYRERHNETSKALDNRENQMATDETQVAADLKTVETRIEDTAQSDYDKRSATADPAIDLDGNHGIIGERKSLNEWDSKLTGWQGELDGFRADLKSWEAKLDNKIDVEAGAIFGEERKPIDKQFTEMHAKLTAYEGKLDKYEVDINNRIHAKYESGIAAEKPGVQADLRAARNEKSQSESELSNAQSEKSRAQSRYNSAERTRDSARSRLRSAESEESRLRSRISSLNSRISSLRSQISSCRSSF